MSKPLTIQYTGKYANHLLREKEKEIERLNNIIEKNKYSADELNEIERLNKDLEYSNYCEEQMRKTITNLEYKIATLEEQLKEVIKSENT